MNPNKMQEARQFLVDNLEKLEDDDREEFRRKAKVELDKFLSEGQSRLKIKEAKKRKNRSKNKQAKQSKKRNRK